MNKRNSINEKIIQTLEAGDLPYPVTLNRPNPLLLNNLPVILVYAGQESIEILSGTQKVPKQYARAYEVNIDIVGFEPELTDFDLNQVAGYIEFLMFQDIYLGDDPATNTEGSGTILGLSLNSTKPYTFDDGADKVYTATNMVFVVYYDTDTYPDKKYKNFEEYKMEIIRTKPHPDADETLIEAEGNI